eukprot:CAMPEP_0198330930 /NCGR_PEP_ID=MMETSP1450-20131203/17243_1 /TAXON_ID=753684 ORGANISM="Madagascaria erythrocladiodes, Strain CCMP3234" /NCGR_SAMPLE_ID=MMETSP1450 /ASSEMBLY_ACC=CAM_ASM_001115 /LENGTH=689 /DNA_ID=CAMNT_0044035263 /DNA_START=91 /DNA_END=2160 /DNA_ORIENTATION=+
MVKQLLSSCFFFVAITTALAFDVSTATYRFPASVDREVLPQFETEIWAEVYRPTKAGKGPFPLVIFLHGNHATCGTVLEEDIEPIPGVIIPKGIRIDDDSTYTLTGRCPRNYVVVPNHEGYRFVAKPLAARGFIVVSINANRGINANEGPRSDPSLNFARGKLILRHLTLLSEWNDGRKGTPKSLGASLKGQIDFSKVGFMGHSRGGEGARAALQTLREPGNPFKPVIGDIDVKAVFEVAPVDGQTSQTLNADGVASIIVLPSCDGDVFDLGGLRVFDRAFRIPDDVERPKGTITVIGANHNAFNTEWQTTDVLECDGAEAIFEIAGESRPQQKTLRRTLIPFFLAYVQGLEERGKVFDPAFPISEGLASVTLYERGHLRAPPGRSVTLVQSFTGNALESDTGLANIAAGVSVTHLNLSFEHDETQRAARLTWNTTDEKFYLVRLGDEDGIDMTDINALSFRVALSCRGGQCRDIIDATPDIDLRVSLVSGKRESQVVKVEDFVAIRRPTGAFGVEHDILRTVDLPLRAFRGARVEKVTGIKFSIVSPSQGRLFIADITTDTENYRDLDFDFRQEVTPPLFNSGYRAVDKVVMPAFSRLNSALMSGGDCHFQSKEDVDGGLLLTFTTSGKFPVMDSMPELVVGGAVVKGGIVLPTMDAVTFFIPAAEKSPQGSASVRMGISTWACGELL